MPFGCGAPLRSGLPLQAFPTSPETPSTREHHSHVRTKASDVKLPCSYADLSRTYYGYAHRPKKKLPSKEQQEKDTKAHTRAREIWYRARRIDGTPAELYLLNRGIARPPTGWPATLRFAEKLHHPFENKDFPAMLAAVGRWNGTKLDFIGIQRVYLQFSGTFLTRDLWDDRKCWRKRTIDARLNLGKVDGGGVWLPLSPDVTTLYVGEGVETVLSVLQLYKVPLGCAATSTAGLQTLVLPPFVKHVVIAADNDPHGKGMEAARRAERRWQLAGIKVEIIKPSKVGEDFNDLIHPKVGARRYRRLQEQDRREYREFMRSGGIL